MSGDRRIDRMNFVVNVSPDDASTSSIPLSSSQCRANRELVGAAQGILVSFDPSALIALSNPSNPSRSGDRSDSALQPP